MAYDKQQATSVIQYALTAQDAESLQKDLDKMNLQQLKVFSDPSNEVVNYLKEKYLPNLAIDAHSGYPNGMVQPAELGFVGRTVVVAWTHVPKMSNAYGAMGRPDQVQVIAKLEAKETTTKSDGMEMMPKWWCSIL